MTKKRLCVYSVLFGDYESLNEQPIALEDQNTDFILFTDNPDLRSKTWQIRTLKPQFPMDYPRSQRIPKTVPPSEILTDYEFSLYIDNSVILKSPPQTFFFEYLTEGDDLCFLKHSFRATVFDEFLEVIRVGYDDPGRVLELLNHIFLMNPASLQSAPLWGAIIFRRHSSDSLWDAMKSWQNYILRYSRRDQLSLRYVLSLYPIKLRELALSNHETSFHHWPVTKFRKNLPDFQSSIQNLIPNQLILDQKIENLERQISQSREDQELKKQLIEKMRKDIADKDFVLNQILSSSSWKLTAPLRRVGDLLKT